MQNPFAALGVPVTADAETIHVAYRKLVKLCHPDAVQEEALKQQAQDRMIALNVAYAEALRRACRPPMQVVPPTLNDSLRLAQKLLDKDMASSALRALERCREDRSATWHYLHGRALHHMDQFELAHRSLRQAVRMDPDNKEYRLAALKSYTAERDSHKLSHKMARWAGHLVGGRGK